RTGMAILFLLWNVLVTFLLAENVLKPLLIGRKDTELSSLMVFLGVFGGIPACGLLGVFIGPMALAAGLMLVRVLRSLAREGRVSAATCRPGPEGRRPWHPRRERAKATESGSRNGPTCSRASA